MPRPSRRSPRSPASRKARRGNCLICTQLGSPATRLTPSRTAGPGHPARPRVNHAPLPGTRRARRAERRLGAHDVLAVAGSWRRADYPVMCLRYVSGRETRSACRPGPEFLGVAYGPDVLDPVAGDLEREHRHGDAVLLGDQAGLAIDRALQESQARCPADDIEGGAGDLLAAFDRALGDRADEAAGVGDGRGAGIQEADEGRDVPGFPGLFEVPDEAGLPTG